MTLCWLSQLPIGHWREQLAHIMKPALETMHHEVFLHLTRQGIHDALPPYARNGVPPLIPCSAACACGQTRRAAARSAAAVAADCRRSISGGRGLAGEAPGSAPSVPVAKLSRGGQLGLDLCGSSGSREARVRPAGRKNTNGMVRGGAEEARGPHVPGDFGQRLPHKRVAYFRQQPLAATCLDDDFGLHEQEAGFGQTTAAAMCQAAYFGHQPTASGLKLLCHHARLSDVTNSEADDLVLAALRRSTLAAAGQVVALGLLGRGGPGPVTKGELAACKRRATGCSAGATWRRATSRSAAKCSTRC
jgi:hypothetical protein